MWNRRTKVTVFLKGHEIKKMMLKTKIKAKIKKIVPKYKVSLGLSTPIALKVANGISVSENEKI